MLPSHSSFALPAGHLDAQNWLASRAERWFPGDSEAILRLCLLGGELLYPAGYSHPNLLLELVSNGAVSEKQFEDIAAGYMFFCAYYFLLDSVCDQHLADVANSTYLTHLCVLGHSYFNESVRNLSNDVRSKCIDQLFRHLSENSCAVRTEIQLRAQLCCDTASSEACDIGRSNIFLLPYYFFALISDVPADEQELALDTLRRYILMRQRLDDLGDWREDCLKQNYTPFLRAILSDLEPPFTEKQFEEKIYLTGAYERELSICINHVTSLRQVVSEKLPHASILHSALSHEYALATQQLQRWLSTKLDEID